MKFLAKLPPSKAWRLAMNTKTGQIYTGNNGVVYYGKPDQQKAKIDKAIEAFNKTGELTPDGTIYVHQVWDSISRTYKSTGPYTGPSLHDVVLFDHIPVIEINARFKRLYRGTSDVAVKFTTEQDHEMILRGASSDKFFELVGQRKIIMNPDGFYNFNVSFVKAGDKVYMELHGY